MRAELAQQYFESDEYLRKLKARSDLKHRLDDPLERAQMIANVYAVDPVRFIEDWLIIKIPELGNVLKPFFLFDYQKDIIWRLVEAERSLKDSEILIDKLRGMGMTWLIAAYMYWRWLYTPRWSGFILSRTEDEVDDGTSSPDNCIFGKIRFFIQYSPDWMLPEGFTSKGKKGTSTDSKLRLMNPMMESSINGSSTNQNAGRSRRYSFVFVDECFYIEHFLSVWRALQSVSRVKLFVSSVKQGRVSKDFRDMCQQHGNYISLDFKLHPWKDEQWYKEKEKLAEFDPEVLKEISVDYSVNVRNQYYPEIRESLVEPVEYDRHKPLYCFLDFGKQDLTVIGLAQFDGNWVNVLDGYANHNKPLEWYMPFLNPELMPNLAQYNEAQREVITRFASRKKPVIWFGEVAHFQKVMPLNKSIAQECAKYGVRIMYNQYAIKYEPRRHATSLLLPKTRFNESSEFVMELYDALASSRYSNAVAPTSKDTVLKPAHDELVADYRAAFENLCTNIPRIIRHQREEVKENFRADNFSVGIMKYLRI